MCWVRSRVLTATLLSSLSPLEGSSTLSNTPLPRSTGTLNLPSEAGTLRLVLPPKGELRCSWGALETSALQSMA